MRRLPLSAKLNSLQLIKNNQLPSSLLLNFCYRVLQQIKAVHFFRNMLFNTYLTPYNYYFLS